MHKSKHKDPEEPEETPKGALSEKTKGLLVGAASALSLVGVIYAIMEQEKPKAHAKTPHVKPSNESSSDESQPTGPADKIPVFRRDGSYAYVSFDEARALGAVEDADGSWDRRENFRLYGPKPTEEAEVAVTETSTDEGGVQITTVLKDIGTVGTAARGLAALEPVAEMLIALL